MMQNEETFPGKWKCGACGMWYVTYIKLENGNYRMRCLKCNEDAPYTEKKIRKNK